MFNKLIFCCVIMTTFLSKCEAARILAVLPVPVISHQSVFRVLIRELVKRGHEVTMITALSAYEKDQAPVNYTEINVSELLSDVKQQALLKKITVSEDLFSQFILTFKLSIEYIEGILRLRKIQNLMKLDSKYFDLIFIEDCFQEILIFTHVFNAPVIQMSSFGGTFETFEAVGAATHPFLFPLAVRQRYHDLTLWDKISEMYLQYRLERAYDATLQENQVFKKHFGEHSPTLSILRKNVHMVFLNLHPIWDSNRPVPTNIIYLGGLHQKPQAELPKELKSSLDSAVNGMIYVSFGNNVKPDLFSTKKAQILVNVFSRLPYDVYWKWNDEKLPELSKNIKVFKWFPQSDLLIKYSYKIKKKLHVHPNIKLFITQGGLQSTDEAIAAGVPLIGIPMMWDQWYNVNKYLELNIGLEMDLNTITENKLKDAIESVILDKRYKENIIKLRSLMRDQQQSPLERAVWWTEYVIRHKGALHLRSHAANMTWVEYYEVKLIVLILAFLICAVKVVIMLILRVIRFFVTKKIKTE